MNKMTKFLCLLLPLTLLTACGGGGGGGDGGAAANTQSLIRLVNASTDATSLDLLVTGQTAPGSGTSVPVATNVAPGTASNYTTITSGALNVSLQNTGTTTTTTPVLASFIGGANYTLLAYNANNSTRSLTIASISDSVAAPAVGASRVVVANYAGGSLDIFVEAVGVNTGSPKFSGLTGTGVLTDLPSGNYHIWVTSTGSTTNILLDIPSVTLTSQQVVTLALTSAAGGSLLDGTMITQGGAVTTHRNTSSRLRLVNNVTSGLLAATLNGVSMGSIPVAQASVYTTVPSGPLVANTLTIGGTPVTLPALNATAGADLTLLVYGNPAAPTFSLLTDNNRRSVTTTSALLRVVNGINGLTTPVSVYLDSSNVLSSINNGAASAYQTILSGNPPPNLQVDIYDDVSGNALYTGSISRTSQSVTTLFLLGSSAAPNVRLTYDQQ